MKIAIIGAGNVGGTLGGRWSEKGHDVVYGVRDPAKYASLNATNVAKAVADAEVVVLATPWPATEGVIREAGDWSGKIVVDTTNPVAPGFGGLVQGRSAGEQVADWAAGARVVKAFNTIGFNVMAQPAFPDGAATLLYAGDDAEAKATVRRLSEDIGFEPVDAGPLSMAHYLEAQAWIWISLAMKYGQGRDIAFRLVRR